MNSIDRDTFTRLVGESLVHLYDEPFLAAHPLGELLVDARDDGTLRLQRLLLASVEALKPSPSAAPESPLWRRYQYVRRRYVEGQALERIAHDLAIGDRQARRYNREGIEAVAGSLWSIYSRRRLGDPSASSSRLGIAGIGNGARVAGEAREAHDAERVALASELASITTADVGVGPTPLAEILGSALDTVAGLLESRRLHVEVSLASDLPPVVGHRIVLRQVLLGVLVHLAEQQAGKRARITATSDGASVDVEIQTEPSVPARRPRRPAGVATVPDVPSGDQLSSVARLVDFLHGSLEARSGKGEADSIGWCLRLRLPASSPVSVLLIDDNLDFRRLVRRFLEDSVYRAIFAEVTEDVVAVAAERHPDVIVLDVMMPTRDGWEVLQALKGRADTKQIPVIVCSVLREPTLALALGAVATLVKPITRADLIGCLDRLSPRSDPAGGPATSGGTPSLRRP